MKKRRRGAACRRLPQRTQSGLPQGRTQRNKSKREFLRKSYQR